jgi:FkbM family methyltransferase
VGCNGALRRAWRAIRPLPLGPDAFLADCSKIAHVGANTGAERHLYESVGLKVIWVEPIPQVFAELQCNIRGFRRQEARQGLAADVSGRIVTFHLANNGGASSSMFEFADHSRIWPEVRFAGQIELETVRLDDLLADVAAVDALVLDTQGAELVVLQGAERLIGACRFIKAEAADFESYRGGCTLDELDAFLRARGFAERFRHEFASASGVGRYFDVIWERVEPTPPGWPETGPAA